MTAPRLGRRYFFDGGCSVPAASAVEPFVSSGGAVGDLTPPPPPPVGRRSPAALDEAVAAKAGELAGRPPLVTMADAVAAICGVRAHACICGREPGHDDYHECPRPECQGRWIGTHGAADFEPVRFPGDFA